MKTETLEQHLKRITDKATEEVAAAVRSCILDEVIRLTSAPVQSVKAPAGKKNVSVVDEPFWASTHWAQVKQDTKYKGPVTVDEVVAYVKQHPGKRTEEIGDAFKVRDREAVI